MEDAIAWTLNVVFTGLITFVPVQDGKVCDDCQRKGGPEPASVAVLFADGRLAEKGEDGHAVPPHMPAIIYDPAEFKLIPLQADLERGPDLVFEPLECDHAAQVWRRVKRHAVFLDGYSLALPEKGGISWDVGEGLISLAAASNRFDDMDIPPACLQPPGCLEHTLVGLHVKSGVVVDQAPSSEVVFKRLNKAGGDPVKHGGEVYSLLPSEEVAISVAGLGRTASIYGRPRCSSNKPPWALRYVAASAGPVRVDVKNMPIAGILGLRELSHHDGPQRHFHFHYSVLTDAPSKRPVPYPATFKDGETTPQPPTYEMPVEGGKCWYAKGIAGCPRADGCFMESHPRCPPSKFR